MFLEEGYIKERIRRDPGAYRRLAVERNLFKRIVGRLYDALWKKPDLIREAKQISKLIPDDKEISVPIKKRLNVELSEELNEDLELDYNRIIKYAQTDNKIIENPRLYRPFVIGSSLLMVSLIGILFTSNIGESYLQNKAKIIVIDNNNKEDLKRETRPQADRDKQQDKNEIPSADQLEKDEHISLVRSAGDTNHDYIKGVNKAEPEVPSDTTYDTTSTNQIEEQHHIPIDQVDSFSRELIENNFVKAKNVSKHFN